MLIFKQTNRYTFNSVQGLEDKIVPFETPFFDEPTTPTHKSAFQKGAIVIKNTTQHPNRL